MKEVQLNRKAVLLEALEYIDRDLIAEVIDEIKAPDMKQTPECDKTITRKSIKYALLLAACLVLISAVIPVASYLITHFELFRAGSVGETTTESRIDIPEEHSANASYPIFTPDLEPISDEMIGKVKEAWYQLVYDSEYEAYSKYYEAGNFSEKDKISGATKAATSTAERYVSLLFSPNKEDHFRGRYYGTINNCIILAFNTYLEGEYNVIALGNTVIKNDNSFYIFAYRDGVIKTVKEAYTDEWLKDEDIQKIKERHGQFNDYAYWEDDAKPSYSYAKFIADLEEIPDDTIEEINNILFEKKFEFGYSLWKDDRTYKLMYDQRKVKEMYAQEAYVLATEYAKQFIKDQNESLASYEESFRYYGTFSGKVIWANVSDMTAVTQFTLNGLYFFYSTQTTHYVYVNGEVMDLMDAYEKGLLTNGDVINLYYRYCVYNAYIGEPNRAKSEDSYAVFTVTPEQDAIISDIFGHYYAMSFDHWDEYLGKCLNKEEADIWNSTAPSDILSILEFFSQDSRFFKLWRTTPNDSSFSYIYYVSITPEQDAIITELVDEKYKCYAGFWDIWFSKILDPLRTNEWNNSNLTSYEEIKKFMEDNRVAEKIERGVPLYSE